MTKKSRKTPPRPQPNKASKKNGINVKTIMIALASVGLLVIVTIGVSNLLRYQGDPAKIPAIDFQGMEPQVQAKLQRLVEDVQSHPDDAERWGKLGMNFYIHEYEEAAIVCYQEAHKLDAYEFRWPYFCGYAMAQIKNPDAAIWFEKSLSIQERYAPAHVRFGEALLSLDQTEMARRSFKNALKLDKRLSHAYLGDGKAAYAQNDLDKAVKQLETAIQINPGHRDAYGLLVNCYRELQQPEKVTEYAALQEKYPQKLVMDEAILAELTNEGVSAYWYRERGKAYMRQKMNEQAAAEFKRALEIAPDAQLYHDRGIVLSRLNRLPDAVESFRLAVEMEPDNVPFLSNFGTALCRLEQFDEGVTYLKKANDMDPTYRNACINLADYYTRVNRWQDAVSVYRRSVKADTANHIFTFNLAWLLSTAPDASARNGKEALRYAEKLSERSRQENAKVLDVLAAAYAESGQFRRALSTIEQAITLAEGQSDNALAETFKRRKAQYQQQRPWRIKAAG